MNSQAPPRVSVRISSLIIMAYKEQCKTEGEILTRIKIIRTVLSGTSQKEAAAHWQCSKNTIGAIMEAYESLSEEQRELLASNRSFTKEDVNRFEGLGHQSRKPNGNKRSLSAVEEETILTIHKSIAIGPKRMHTHLKRSGKDMAVYTLSKIKGCYKRNKLLVLKVRTRNKERRPLYDYTQLAAFEHLHMDTKHIADQHALPKEIYEKFKGNPDLPLYQWTIIDAKTRMRFLAYSRELNSFFGQRFLLFTILWLRAHSIQIHMNVLFDGGPEFCLASEKKLAQWQSFFSSYGVTVEQTNGDKVRQNLIERSHRPDDEEFYCPRGPFINSKTDFLIEAQSWQIYWNLERSHSGIGMHDMTPAEKLSSLGYTNASTIGTFPTLILEDMHTELLSLPTLMKKWERPAALSYPQIESQYVFTYYHYSFV